MSQDIALVERGFAEIGLDAELVSVHNCERCLDFLHRQGDYGVAPTPDLVLVDLNSPGVKGLELLQAIRNDEQVSLLPVIALTDAEGKRNVLESYRLRVNSFLNKPQEYDEFLEMIRSFGNYWMGVATLPSGKSGERSTAA